MTIVVGVEHSHGVVLACDSQGSNGWQKTQRKDPKIFTAHGMGYGFTTSYRMGQILRYHTEPVFSDMREIDLYGYVVSCLVPMYRRVLGENGFKEIENGRETGGTFLLAIDGKLFCIEDDFQVGMSSRPYHAVGCGYQYAMGYLFSHQNTEDASTMAVNAVEAAKTFSNGCGGEVLTISVGKKAGL